MTIVTLKSRAYIGQTLVTQMGTPTAVTRTVPGCIAVQITN
ncbi:MAG: hypothetical protein QOE57_3525 [Acidimicrobiaceae bacterium]|jgi:hypothetical protein|nr:hypothetical protein [Acidimicrobiaceae bacterium]